MSGPPTAVLVDHEQRANPEQPNEHQPRQVLPAANDNTSSGPIVVLHATGNGELLYRALARVLVRRELNAAAIRLHDDLEPSHPTK